MPTNRQWILRRRPAGEIVPDDLELIEITAPAEFATAPAEPEALDRAGAAG